MSWANDMRSAKYIALVLMASSTFLATSVKADEDLDSLLLMSLEELSEIEVTVASKRLEKVSDAPGIITVITSADIKKYGGNNLYDILARIPNMGIVRGVPLFLGNLGFNIRGQTEKATDSHQLMLLNGRPVRESQYGGWTAAIYNSFPIQTIERIEVIRGPGSALYGTNAYAGVINVITKKVKNDQDEGSASVGYGSFNTRQASAAYRKKYQKGYSSGGVKYLNSDGWKMNMVDRFGVADTQKRSESSYGAVFVTEYDNWSVNFFTGLIKKASLGIFPEWPMGEHKQRRDFLDVGYKYPINSDWDVAFNVTYNGFENYAVTPTIPALDQNEFNDILYETMVSGRPMEGVNVVAGLVYDDRGGTLKTGGGKFNQSISSGYFQADYQYNQYLKLVGGAQLNKPEGLEKDISPRFGVIVHATPEMGVKILHGKAFRTATAAEQRLEIPIISGNPDLEPEKIVTTDLQLFYHTNNYSSALTYYRSTAKNGIATAPNPDPAALKPFTYLNGGKYHYEGLEFEGKMQVTKEFEFNGSLAYQRGKNTITGDENISLVPHFYGKLGASYVSDDGYNIGVFGNYYGDVSVNLTPATPFANPVADSYTIVTAKADLNINTFFELQNFSDTTLSLFVDNVLDEEIYVTQIDGGINSIHEYSGRAFYASVGIKF